jgi:hypothetical protein
MKKIILVLGLIVLGNCLFGQEIVPRDFGLTTGYFSATSSKLSPFADTNPVKAQRAEDSKMTAFLLNFILGFGIGSFVQGDTTGGLVAIMGDAFGYMFIMIGLIPDYELVYHSNYYGGYYTTEVTYPYGSCIYLGAILLIGTRIFELVRPFTYANSFSVAVNPSIDVNGQPALTATVKIKL